ncbi:MAG: hypothetical protein DRI46_05920 [Chloroflexi bacterium]|nr:MAG: hypothetical protein DRI46_05920 [Chloroflexota bacterium]
MQHLSGGWPGVTTPNQTLNDISSGMLIVSVRIGQQGFGLGGMLIRHFSHPVMKTFHKENALTRQ